MHARDFLCLLVAVAAAWPAHAAPVDAKPVKPYQPDGTTIDALCWGDDYYVVAESPDGYTLVRDPQTGFICYAAISPDGTRLVSTGAAVGRSQVPPGLAKHLRIRPEAAAAQALAARQKAMVRGGRKVAPLAMGPRASPSTGSVQGICLIVDFSDAVNTIPLADVANYCNQVGYSANGNNGSIRDYYFDVSNGQLTLTHYVPTAYYRAPDPKSYYADPSENWGDRARELLYGALEWLDDSGFDFSQYDADGDGQVDAVSMLYAGSCPNAWSEGLWPGRFSLPLYFLADGVSVRQFQMTDMGSALTISTFCHECGHLLMDWPDLYDYGNDSFGVGRYCIMCNGGSATNPVEPCAYLKLAAGWASLTELNYPPYPNLTAWAGTNSVFRIPHPSLSNEYYLIENRQRTGRDVNMPDAGLAIWHIDTDGSNDNQEMTPSSHYLVTLVQADGLWDLEGRRNTSDLTDLFRAPDYTACTPNTSPNTRWWSGEPSCILIENISASGNAMTFSVDVAAGDWVDFAYGGFWQFGTYLQPYNTFARGVDQVPAGATLWIKAGTSSESAIVTKGMTLRAYGGTAVIGP